MQTIIQHSLDGNIAEKISSNFKVFETHIRHKLTADLEVLRQTYQTDFNDLPAADFAQIKLFISDMDSTIINIESIDEIADFADLKPEVARLTELAMKGKLDFSDALIQRTALLKGLEFEVLEKVYSERLRDKNRQSHCCCYCRSNNYSEIFALASH
ncbi:MAG: hypothetical protein HAW58_05405 [Candidatus Thioglobus sp.]|nr:hypothetical protein [Candidatus Thioglobus sp.]